MVQGHARVNNAPNHKPIEDLSPSELVNREKFDENSLLKVNKEAEDSLIGICLCNWDAIA